MIGLLNDCFPPIMDGVAMTVKNYADWLTRRGEDVAVMTADVPGAQYDYPYPVYRYFSVPVPLRSPYRYGLPQFDYRFQRRLAQLPLELVHAHSPFVAGDLALQEARRRHIPLIATFHSKYKDDFMRVVHSETIVNRLLRNVVRFFDAADEVWIPQRAVGETLREYGYRGHMEVVENGNDYAACPCSPLLKREAKARLGISAHVPMLLFVGQHIWEKNPRLILESLSQLTMLPWQMVFVGEGYAKEEMMQLARQLRLNGVEGQPDRVTFVPCLKDREALRQYYLAADLFVFPSLYDNAPLVAREAAAMHVPSLMVRGATCAEVVRDGVNGFLACNDTTAFARALAFLLERPVVLERAGDMAAKTLTRTWEDIVAEVGDRYQHLIYRYNHKVV